MSRPAGVLIALSGVDSAGKSTQRDLLLEALRLRGYAPITFWTRAGYTPGLEALKRLVKAARGKRDPRSGGVSEQPGGYPRRAENLGHPLLRRVWLSAALLDLLWSYAVRVRLWKRRGLVVVCDRYLLDCLVDFRVNFPETRVEQYVLWRLLRRLSEPPDAAVCLVIPAEVSMERSRGKGRFHWETPEALDRRRREYMAASEELGVRVIDAEQPVADIARAIHGVVDEVLASPSPQGLRPEPIGTR